MPHSENFNLQLQTNVNVKRNLIAYYINVMFIVQFFVYAVYNIILYEKFYQNTRLKFARN